MRPKGFEPFLTSKQERVLRGPNGVGRGGWALPGGPAQFVVAVSVGRNYRTRQVWYPGDGEVGPVVCPQRSAVRCGVLPADA